MTSTQSEREAELPEAEEALVCAAQAGDVQAFSALVEKHQRLARAIAYSVTSDYSITEDLAQEAMVSAWLRLADLGDPKKFRPWLATIVRNTAHYWRRHQGRHAPRAQFGLEVLEQMADGDGSPLESAMEKQDQAQAHDALEGLPARYKEPLLLYYCLDQSHAQVASALGVSEAAVRQRLCRARKKLKQDISGVERTSGRLRNQVSAAASVLLIIQSRQAWAHAATHVGSKSLLASPKLFVGLGAMAGGALVACVAALVFFLGAQSPSSADASKPRVQAVETSAARAASLEAAPAESAMAKPPGPAEGADSTLPLLDDSRALVLIGTGRVKDPGETRGRNKVTEPQPSIADKSSTTISRNASDPEQKSPNGRIHKHGPARLHKGDEDTNEESTEARPLLRPSLDLKAVQRELWQD